MQFVEAANILRGASLVEAAKFYHRHHRQVVRVRSVAQVVVELLEARQSEGCSEVHVRCLRTHLERFASAFSSPIGMVLGPEMQAYLQGLKTVPPKGREPKGFVSRPLSAKSKTNVRKSIQNLFRFARRCGYLPKGPTEADELRGFKIPMGAIEIFTPGEVSKLLQHAKVLLPFIAIGAFAGLRHAEILRLDWREVDLEDGHIEVKAKKSKTGNRRLVPLPDNLKAWLQPHHRGEGKVIPYASVNNLIMGAAKRSGVPWKHNGLRHSFISYRVAEVQNVAQVALEAGNSPQIIFANYRELVKPKEATAWFDVCPDTPENVVTMRQTA